MESKKILRIILILFLFIPSEFQAGVFGLPFVQTKKMARKNISSVPQSSVNYSVPHHNKNKNWKDICRAYDAELKAFARAYPENASRIRDVRKILNQQISISGPFHKQKNYLQEDLFYIGSLRTPIAREWFVVLFKNAEFQMANFATEQDSAAKELKYMLRAKELSSYWQGQVSMVTHLIAGSLNMSDQAVPQVLFTNEAVEFLVNDEFEMSGDSEESVTEVLKIFPQLAPLKIKLKKDQGVWKVNFTRNSKNLDYFFEALEKQKIAPELLPSNIEEENQWLLRRFKENFNLLPMDLSAATRQALSQFITAFDFAGLHTKLLRTILPNLRGFHFAALFQAGWFIQWTQQITQAQKSANPLILHQDINDWHLMAQFIPAMLSRWRRPEKAVAAAVDIMQTKSLHEAVVIQDINAVQDWLEKGADINERDADGDTPLHLAASRNLISIIHLLRKNDAKMDLYNKKGLTPLHVAAQNRNTDIIRSFLVGMHRIRNSKIINKGTLVEEKESAETPLRTAIANNNAEAVHHLISFSADFSNEDLHLAQQTAHETKNNAVLRILHELGVVGELLISSTEVPAAAAADAAQGPASIFIAAAQGNIDAVKSFLSKDILINAVDPDGFSALHYAARAGKTEMVQFLIKNRANVNIQTSRYKLTPLHLATQNNRISTVQALLSAPDIRVNLSERDKGNAAIHIACDYEFTEIAEMLIQKKAICWEGNRAGHTPLHLAAMYGHLDIIKKLYVRISGKFIKDRELKDSWGNTPLHLAGQFGQTEVVSFFLAEGADVTVINSEKMTPFYLACYHNNLDTVRALLQYNNQVDVGLNAKTKLGVTPLFMAVSSENKELIELLLEAGANPNIGNDNRIFPLHMACIRNRADLVQFLVNLKYHVDLEAQSSGFNTALHIVSQKGYLNIAEILIKAGAKIEVKSRNGSTSLHLAVQNGQVGAARLLLEHKANIEARNNYAFTPLIMAAKYGQKEMVEFLMNRGAKLDPIDGHGKNALWHAEKNNHFEIRDILYRASRFAVSAVSADSASSSQGYSRGSSRGSYRGFSRGQVSRGRGASLSSAADSNRIWRKSNDDVIPKKFHDDDIGQMEILAERLRQVHLDANQSEIENSWIKRIFNFLQNQSVPIPRILKSLSAWFLRLHDDSTEPRAVFGQVLSALFVNNGPNALSLSDQIHAVFNAEPQSRDSLIALSRLLPNENWEAAASAFLTHFPQMSAEDQAELKESLKTAFSFETRQNSQNSYRATQGKWTYSIDEKALELLVMGDAAIQKEMLHAKRWLEALGFNRLIQKIMDLATDPILNLNLSQDLVRLAVLQSLKLTLQEELPFASIQKLVGENNHSTLIPKHVLIVLDMRTSDPKEKQKIKDHANRILQQAKENNWFVEVVLVESEDQTDRAFTQITQSEEKGEDIYLFANKTAMNFWLEKNWSIVSIPYSTDTLDNALKTLWEFSVQQ